MAVIENLIQINEDNTISFGNYLLNEKSKVPNFEVSGDIYNLKTYKEITRLEKNGALLIETLPGSTVHNFNMKEEEFSFQIESNNSLQITLELEAETEYSIKIDDESIGTFKTNLAGKLIFSHDFDGSSCSVKIIKL